jgi:nucleotide-binding universal stress UspA family protein
LEDRIEQDGIVEQVKEVIDGPFRLRQIPNGLPTFGRILVAYDGMQISKSALSYAAYISKVSGSQVVIINVIESNRNSINTLPITLKVVLQENEEQIDFAESSLAVLNDEALRKVIEEMIAGCKAARMKGKIIYKIHGGNPAEEIIAIGNCIHFDLIIMGSRRITSRIQGLCLIHVSTTWVS